MGKVKYPIIIEVPEGYWTISTTIDEDLVYDPNKYWHHGEDD